MSNTFAATEAAFAELSAQAGSDSPSEQQTTTDVQDNAPTGAADDATPATEGQPTDTTQQSSTESDDQVPLSGSLPVDRHKKILEKTRSEYDQRLAKLAWAERLQERFADADPETLTERLRALAFAESDPVAFLERFEQALAADPRWAQRLQSRRQPPASREPEQPREEPMPQPDVELEDGRRLYSADQLSKLMEWQANRVTRQIEERYAPVEQEFKGRAAWDAAVRRNQLKLQEARENWPGFKEHEAEIAAYLQKDGRATLDSAYRNVVVPKLKAERAALEVDIRKNLIAELKSKADATTERPDTAAPAAPKSFKGMATSDIVAATYAELAGGSN